MVFSSEVFVFENSVSCDHLRNEVNSVNTSIKLDTVLTLLFYSLATVNTLNSLTTFAQNKIEITIGKTTFYYSESASQCKQNLNSNNGVTFQTKGTGK